MYTCTSNVSFTFNRVTFQEKMQVVHQFMSDNSLGEGLSERVDQFYSLLWRQTKYELHM